MGTILVFSLFIVCLVGIVLVHSQRAMSTQSVHTYLFRILAAMEGPQWDQTVKQLSWLVHVRFAELSLPVPHAYHADHAFASNDHPVPYYVKSEQDDLRERIIRLIHDLYSELIEQGGFLDPAETRLIVETEFMILSSYRRR